MGIISFIHNSNYISLYVYSTVAEINKQIVQKINK